jgi:hypothetical protein
LRPTAPTPTRRRAALQVSCVLGLVCILVLGCAGTLDNPSRFLRDAGAATGDGGACPDVPTSVFAVTCATSGCHSAVDMTQGLDLQSPDVASRLVGACARGGGLLVDPDHPSQSVLYTKLTLAPPFGSRMPLGKTSLDPTMLACVLGWVSAQTGTASPCGDDAGPSPDSGD